MNARNQPVEQRDRVIDDRRIALLHAMHEPARQLEFAVQQRTLGQIRVGTATASRRVGIESGLGGGAARREQPVQVARGIADRQRRPADDRGHPLAVDEDRVGRERSVHHRGSEAPQRVIVGRQLPPAQDRGGEPARVGGAADEFDDTVARLVGVLARQPGGADEPARQGMDGRDRVADGDREPLVLGELVGRAHGTRQEFGDDRPGTVDRGLAHESRNPERQAGADAGSHRPDRDEVGGLLGLGGLGARRADHETATVGGFELHAVVSAVAAAGVRASPAHLESGHRRRGQRG